MQDVSAGLVAFCIAAPCAGGIVAVALETPSSPSTTCRRASRPARRVFSIQTCSAVALDVTGPTVLTGPSLQPALGPGSLPAASSAAEREARIWISFTGTSPGDTTTGTVTVHCPQTGQDFIIPIHANTIPQPTVASVLVLDKSGSMDDPSGIPGLKRIDVLHAAAPGYATLLPDADGIGVVSFDQDAHPVMGVTGAAVGGRTGATAAIAAHSTNLLGMTAIGDGVELAHNTLQPLTGYEHKAMVVFTDGEETASKYIHEVAGLINDRVFAIGLGTVEEVNPVALSKLVANTGGYLLMTDALGPNDTFRLAKYFVQILAGVTNAEVVVDPEGLLPPGVEARIPFDLTEADYGADAIVLSPAPWALDFELETPAGVRIDRTALAGILGVQFTAGAELAFYRLTLPVVVGGVGAQRGRWHIVLGSSKQEWKKYLTSQRERPWGTASHRLGVPYSAIVHARSSLRLAAYATQTSHEPGATLALRAVLTEIDLPVAGRARYASRWGGPMVPARWSSSANRKTASSKAARRRRSPVSTRCVSGPPGRRCGDFRSPASRRAPVSSGGAAMGPTRAPAPRKTANPGAECCVVFSRTAPSGAGSRASTWTPSAWASVSTRPARRTERGGRRSHSPPARRNRWRARVSSVWTLPGRQPTLRLISSSENPAASSSSRRRSCRGK